MADKVFKKPVKVIRHSDPDPKIITIEKREVNSYLAKGFKLLPKDATESKAVVKKPTAKPEK